MPKVSVTVPHPYDPDEVVRRAGPYIERIVEDFEGEDLSVQWHGPQADFSFKILMFKITGDVEVLPQAIRVGIDLPLAAMLFKEKVQKSIEQNLLKALETGAAE